MTRMEHCRALRAREDVHFNCFHSVAIPFAGELGMTEDQLFAIGRHFGGGMRHGSICGCLSGAIGVLGCLGYSEDQVKLFIQSFEQRRGTTACGILLEDILARGEDKKPFCNELIYETLEALEAFVAANKP